MVTPTLTLATTLDPIFILQKKAIRTITFSSYNAPSSQIFKDLKVLKILDLLHYNVAIFTCLNLEIRPQIIFNL